MERLPDFIPTKRVKRCALSQNEKIIILNVYNALKYQYPTNTITDTVTNCSKMTGIGISTIYRLIKDTQNGQGTISSPKSSTGRSKVVIEDDLKNVIRRKVHSFYFKKEIPTLNKILSELSEDNDLPKLNGGMLLFESKNTGDYHEDMNANVFEEYFSQMLDLIPPGSLPFTADRADAYYCLEKSRYNSLVIRKNVSFETNMVKKELLTLVNLNNGDKKYVIDEMAASRQITVLRLPPYHCELNPIELVWAQVKGGVARNNTSFKLSDVKILLENSLERVTADKWQRCIHHIHKEEEKMWELDNLIDVAVEPLVINLGDEDSSDSEDEF
ncbi:hypothetical protein NQ315_011042 [Exocentrus adspersus]|uniref:Tc1-like transposase DDE domain-containing protein n=1 Tax=Exocentrus adspersus TaxID=1586481 RepID=A0AAV8VF87_9CUCU|nr:hypothetical protein NQ315_011042 [Exocentrus adspersus]